MACEPPSATTHPFACAATISISPTAAGHRPVESRERVRGHAGPQRPGLPPSCHTLGQGGGRQHRAGTEARQRQRMARHPQDRLGGVGEQVVEVRRHRLEHPRRHRWTVAPETNGGPVDRSMQDAGGTVVQRMGAVHLRLQPREPAEASFNSTKNGDASAIGWTAEQWSWTRPGTISSALRCPAADRVEGLEHGHVETGAGQ